MIYLIAGVPRSGKSQFSKQLSQKLNIARIDFDDITTAFEALVPEYGLFMTMDQDIREQKAYPIVESLINFYLQRKENLVIEGDNFDLQDWSKYKEICKNSLKMCVFGYGDITQEKKIEINSETTIEQICWFEPLSINEKIRIAQEMIDKSKKMRKEVDEINDLNYIKYFETHPNFKNALEEAMGFCLEDRKPS